MLSSADTRPFVGTPQVGTPSLGNTQRLIAKYNTTKRITVKKSRFKTSFLS